MRDDLLYQVALSLIPAIGPVQARILVERFGSARNVFIAKMRELQATEGIGEIRAWNIKNFKNFHEAEQEIRFIDSHSIQPLFLTQERYPKRLLHCYDAPLILYYKGTADLNASKIVSIVGTRNNTEYGKMLTEELVSALAPLNVLIVSGLAYGVDAIAHKAAIRNNCPTVGVLAHGLDVVYPFHHTGLSKDMTRHGGLLTEFRSGIKPDRHNFPARNRIVAGMSDATVVIETGAKGGSMITAELANGYNRDVFAFPGKTSDSKSAGCNQLIAANKAVLLNSPAALLELLNWVELSIPKQTRRQRQLFIDLSEEETIIVELLKEKELMHIDEINLRTHLSTSAVAAAILKLELQNVVSSVPGKMYTLL